MTWQETLRRIDSDLAAGKLSKEQYAVKREELLAEAAAVDVPPEVPAKTAPPVPAKELLTTTRQTTAPSPADERSTDSMPHPKVGPRPNDTPVPVVKPSEVAPPVALPQPMRPVRHPVPQALPAPDPPELNADRRIGGRWTGLFLGMSVLLVGALIAGMWWLASGEPTPPETSAVPQRTADAKQLPIAELEGRPIRVERVRSPGDLQDLDYLTAPEKRAYREAHPSAVGLGYHTLGNGTGVVILAVRCGPPGSDTRLADQLRDLHLEAGAKTLAGAPPGIRLTGFQDKHSGHGYVRAHYTSNRHVVRIGIDSPRGVKAARADLLAALNAQLDIHPADV